MNAVHGTRHAQVGKGREIYGKLSSPRPFSENGSAVRIIELSLNPFVIYHRGDPVLSLFVHHNRDLYFSLLPLPDRLRHAAQENDFSAPAGDAAVKHAVHLKARIAGLYVGRGEKRIVYAPVYFHINTYFSIKLIPSLKYLEKHKNSRIIGSVSITEAAYMGPG